LLRECSEEVGRHALVEDGSWKELQSSRVLVVGGGTFAVSVILRLFLENDVCLLCSKAALQRLALSQRLLLLELHVEGELRILHEEQVLRSVPMAGGVRGLLVQANSEQGLLFDHVLQCEERATRTKLFQQFSCRHSAG